MNHEGAVTKLSESITAIANAAGEEIAKAIASGKKLPVTLLTKTLSEKLDVNKDFCYQIISTYIKVRGDLYIYKGPGGGIGLPPATVTEEK